MAHIFFFSFKINDNVLSLDFDFVRCFAQYIIVKLSVTVMASHPELHQQVNKQKDEIMENRIMKMSHKIIIFKLLNVTT